MIQKIKSYFHKNKEQISSFSIILNIGLLILLIIQFLPKVEKNTLSLYTDNIVKQHESINSENKIYVEILGQVENPGVYLINETTLVIELLNKAGGITQFADMEYIHKNISLSKFLVSNQKIYIPSKNKDDISLSKDSIININTSSKTDIETLPGIGEITAQKIIDNRPYSELSDLVNREILSENIYNKIVTLIVL